MPINNEVNDTPKLIASVFPKSIWLTALSLALAISALTIAAISGIALVKMRNQLNIDKQQVAHLSIRARVNNVNFHRQQVEMHSLETKLQQMSSQSNPSHIALLDVIHLIHSAHDSLVINTNVSLAINYLELADTQIRALNNPQFNDIRQMISKTVLTLKSLPSIDRAGIIIKLDTLSNAIAELPTVFKPFIGKPYQAPDPTSEPYQANNWRKKLLNCLNHLKSFVIIRHNDQLPILTSEQQDFLKLMLQSKINQTQWAVLNFENDLYQHNLQSISNWLKDYFQQNPSSSALLNEVNSLQAINLQLALPDVLAILIPIQNHLNQLPVTPTTTLTGPVQSSQPNNNKALPKVDNNSPAETNKPGRLPITNPGVEA